MLGILLAALVEGFAFHAAGYAGNKAATAIWNGIAGDPVKAKTLSVSLTKVVQSSLCLLGQNVVIDGIFGKRTETAVKRYQLKKSLVVDGIIGDRTLAAIADDMAKIAVNSVLERIEE